MLADVSVSHPSAPYKSDGATLTDTKGLGRNQLGTFSCLGSHSSALKITACEKSLLKPRDFGFLKCYDRNTPTDARKGRQARKTGRGFFHFAQRSLPHFFTSFIRAPRCTWQNCWRFSGKFNIDVLNRMWSKGWNASSQVPDELSWKL